jgi:glycosyltransferase involved in cell wall biosynthesis
MVLHYKKVFPNGPHVCIYNIIRDSESIRRARTAVDHPWLSDSSIPVIISAGTLTRRKGFADLIYAFAEVCKRRSVRLILLGEGCLRPELEAMICKLGISSVADMPGNVSNPLAYFAKAQVFVLSSYAEGLPNVLVEAMICGCTPVATDCPTGPREVLGAGRFGYLTPMGDPATMATAIEKALDNPISSKLLEEAISPFDENRVIDRHFEMLGLCVS